MNGDTEQFLEEVIVGLMDFLVFVGDHLVWLGVGAAIVGIVIGCLISKPE